MPARSRGATSTQSGPIAAPCLFVGWPCRLLGLAREEAAPAQPLSLRACPCWICNTTVMDAPAGDGRLSPNSTREGDGGFGDSRSKSELWQLSGAKAAGDIMILGRPGAGKGTQAELLSTYLDVPHVCAGDLVREAIRASNSGSDLERLVNGGDILPDDVAVDLVSQRLRQSDCDRGAILDGCARSRGQAVGLDAAMSGMGRTLHLALLIDVSDDVAVDRLRQRQVSAPPGQLSRRDYSPSAISRRLKVYSADTNAALKYYSDRGILHVIDGRLSVQKVHSAIIKLASLREHPYGTPL